ncbi:hypothetical protein [Candidatus Phytoplasma prunorum]|uniref:hypothetical protein n=1 Tax=Candidatus Phytoplasma prunorum TaxID=47565 RepID=UPI002FF1AC90
MNNIEKKLNLIIGLSILIIVIGVLIFFGYGYSCSHDIQTTNSDIKPNINKKRTLLVNETDEDDEKDEDNADDADDDADDEPTGQQQVEKTKPTINNQTNNSTKTN